MKHRILLLSGLCLTLTACIGNFFTGANIIYDRHHIYKKSTDLAIAAQVGHAIQVEPSLYCPSKTCFDIAVFHGDVLLLGTVPSQTEKNKADTLAKENDQYRNIYNYIDITPNSAQRNEWLDNWITTQIRSKVMGNADIDPNPFKVVSHNQVVYLMGDVMDDQSQLIIDIARNTPHVNKVVNLMQSYSLKKNLPQAQPSPPMPNNTPTNQAWDITPG